MKEQIKTPTYSLNKFGFGHVPLKSTMGKTARYFHEQASTLFDQLSLDIYFCGHEHLHWDEENELFPNLRQVIVGTASGTYNFPIRKDLVLNHCDADLCKMPYSNQTFKIKKTSQGAGQQVYKQNWILVTVNESETKLESFALNQDNEVISFYEKENR